MSIVILGLVIFVLSLAGGLAPLAFARKMSGRQLETMTGIAAGLLLASALLVVIPEGFHTAVETGHDTHEEVVDDGHDDELDDDHGHDAALDELTDEEHDEGDAFAFSPAILGLTILAGFATMLVLEGFGVGHAVHEEHHDHVEGHGHGHVHHPSSSSISVLALGLSVHALADGLAIGAAAVAGDTAFSVLVAVAVGIHRVPAALSLGLFALHETNNKPKALRGLFSFALATPLAMLVSYLVLDGADEGVISLALLFSAGTFLYVATVDTLPAIHNPESGRRSVRNVLIGVALITVLVFVSDAAGLLDHGH